MSDIHIIGTLSREDTIEEAALYYLTGIAAQGCNC